MPTSETDNPEIGAASEAGDRKAKPVGKARPGNKRRFAAETIEMLRLALVEPRTRPSPEAPPPPMTRPEPGRTSGEIIRPDTVRPALPGRRVVLEPFSRRDYDLSYACLLIPRFGAHQLRGDVVPFLRSTMYNICVSFGWRLEFLMIRPEFLQWVISAPATTPPSRSIRTIRELTSRKIFEDFPRYTEDNLGADFWAPAYLVLVGPTPHPPETIIEFIRVTRQEQGFLPRRGQ